MAKMQSAHVRNMLGEVEPWELQAVGRYGIPVLQRIEQIKTQARRLAGRNDDRCYLLLLEERLLNDLVVDMASAYLDMERVGRQIQAGRYKVGKTETDLYRAIVH
ncbi:MAG TPA: hypothetical protein VFM98_22610 [Ramlibacter sp.]|uniref:hypothetical protein n=1 Tax=Ramlibacter sp. TaxID=1917967 RepID=UPI002D7EAC47|nr:hypothetical protein [Ramlibacter sp.]HET8748406.1 hypothetical protein [Ramlibacter sp.]